MRARVADHLGQHGSISKNEIKGIGFAALKNLFPEERNGAEWHIKAIFEEVIKLKVEALTTNSNRASNNKAGEVKTCEMANWVVKVCRQCLAENK